MEQTGSFRIVLANEEQVKAVIPVIQEWCPETWLERLVVNKNTIEIPDSHITMEEYAGRVKGFCKSIAEKYPDFDFIVTAYGSDDEGFYSYDEKGSLKDGMFDFTIDQKEPGDEEDIDWEEIDPEEFDYDEAVGSKEAKIHITGHLENGKMVFEEKEL